MPFVTAQTLPASAPSTPVSGIPRTLRLCLKESRPAVLAAFQLRFLAGVALVPASTTVLGVRPALQATLCFVAWFCAVFYTYLYNGYMDYREDRVNESTRPIASLKLPRSTALTVARCAALAALICAAGAGLGALLLCTALLLLGYGYSSPRTAWKNRTPAVMGVVFVSGLLTYSAGPVALGSSPASPALLLTAFAMSLWMALVGAVAKDFSDIEGDIASGRRTWAITLGERRARLLVAVGACAVGGGYTAGAAAWAPELLPVASVVLAGAVVLATVTLTGQGATRRSRRRLPYRCFMGTQHCAHLALLGQAVI
ncbi:MULTISPECIES: UbiA family prenyltransferase [unclassified Streptomyces]|uniref:UbiA family prenyltransferase n=1 Tax=unclassified Streptomyces TaxID=2593676 RepID=UPI002440F06B|nr:UbiA family prenyltransferase [Streptomyces sp. DH41]MDG9722063.1 UbiA family prenyltransferase [Streptomyces sp. DH41]